MVDEARVIDTLRAGEKPFLAWGYSELKLTRDGLVEMVKLPIKAFGVMEVMERWNKKRPSPPTQLKAVKKDSDEGRSLGLKHDKIVEYTNEADPNYIEILRQHDDRAGYSILLAGVAIDITGEGEQGEYYLRGKDINKSTEVIDEDKAITVFRDSGMSSEHFIQIVGDIRRLTQKEADVADLE